MDCPVCKEPMIVMELDQVEIDHCIKCKGIWLDEGELEILLEGADGRDRILNSLSSDFVNDEDKRSCPICLKPMKKAVTGAADKVLIDRCGKNHGLWLDAGELPLILALGRLGEDTKILNLLKKMFGENPNTQKEVPS